LNWYEPGASGIVPAGGRFIIGDQDTDGPMQIRSECKPIPWRAMAGRFSISVPGRRGPSDPWFRIGTLDVNTAMLVVLMCVASIFVWAFEGREHPVSERLFLWPDRVFDGQVWRIVTWPLVNEPTIWLVISLALLWYFGSEIERLLGRNRFAIFVLLVTVIPAVVGTLIDLPQSGIRPIEMAVFLLFVVEYPFVRFFFGIPAWAIGGVILGIEILQLLGERNEKGILFLFVVLAVAALTARTMGLLLNLPWVPAVPIGGNRTRRRRPKPSRGRGDRLGRGGDVVTGPWASSSRSGPVGTAPLPQPPASAADRAADQAELDRLLDKISEAGMDGLSADEKRRLNELSKRMRGRR
jgi:membrane associated rhomboid family serine protease